MNTVELYQELTHTLESFLSKVEQADLKNHIYEHWDIKDIVGHITYWHINYAANLKACDQKRKPPLLKGKYIDLNQKGVDEMRKYSFKELRKKLLDANLVIGNVVRKGDVRKVKYKEGTRDYSIEEFLQVITSHIKGHIRDVRRTLKKI